MWVKLNSCALIKNLSSNTLPQGKEWDAAKRMTTKKFSWGRLFCNWAKWLQVRCAILLRFCSWRNYVSPLKSMLNFVFHLAKYGKSNVATVRQLLQVHWSFSVHEMVYEISSSKLNKMVTIKTYVCVQYQMVLSVSQYRLFWTRWVGWCFKLHQLINQITSVTSH